MKTISLVIRRTFPDHALVASRSGFRADRVFSEVQCGRRIFAHVRFAPSFTVASVIVSRLDFLKQRIAGLIIWCPAEFWIRRCSEGFDGTKLPGPKLITLCILAGSPRCPASRSSQCRRHARPDRLGRGKGKFTRCCVRKVTSRLGDFSVDGRGCHTHRFVRSQASCSGGSSRYAWDDFHIFAGSSFWRAHAAARADRPRTLSGSQFLP